MQKCHTKKKKLLKIDKTCRKVSKKQVFLVSVLFSAHTERIGVSCIRDFSDVIPKFTLYYMVGNYNMILNGTLNEKKAILKQWQDSLKKIDSIELTDSIMNC